MQLEKLNWRSVTLLRPHEKRVDISCLQQERHAGGEGQRYVQGAGHVSAVQLRHSAHLHGGHQARGRLGRPPHRWQADWRYGRRKRAKEDTATMEWDYGSWSITWMCFVVCVLLSSQSSGSVLREMKVNMMDDGEGKKIQSHVWNIIILTFCLQDIQLELDIPMHLAMSIKCHPHILVSVCFSFYFCHMGQ